MHDILEDTPITYEQLEQKFGNEIAKIVESITKVSFFAKENREQIKSMYLRKLYISMAKDIRVIIIKIADRLHNMQTISFHTKEKQKEIATETLEIYSAIAHRLGMKEAQSQLEDLSFKVLNPKEYKKIKNLLKINKDKLQKILINTKEEIKRELYKKTNKKYIILNRTKSIYSIYRKIHILNKSFEDIHDILAIRIIVNSVNECYQVLGLIHKMFIPLPGKFKDFISTPKNNLYQSLHTTVTNLGYIFEIQIRTVEMDKVAKYGAAAHWRYKEGKKYDPKNIQKDIENQLDIFSQILEINDQNNIKVDTKNKINFENKIQEDIFSSLIYVLTPKGKVITLPYGSSILDFSYKIHSEIGNTTIGARINGKFSTISTILKSGDLVEIITSKTQKPNYSWLSLVKTNSAKDKIKKNLIKENENIFTKKISDNEKIKIIKNKIKFKFAKINPNVNIYWKHINIKEELKNLGYDDLNKFLIDVYDKNIDFNTVLKILSPSNLNKNKEIQEKKFIEQLNQKQQNINKLTKTNNDLIVKGIDNIDLALSKCCYPLPFEDIIGIINRRLKIIKVHLKNCKFIKNIDSNLFLQVSWNKNVATKKTYLTKINIISADGMGILMKISSILNFHQSSIDKIIINKKIINNKVLIKLTFKVKNKTILNQIISSLQNLSIIYEVNRINN